MNTRIRKYLRGNILLKTIWKMNQTLMPHQKPKTILLLVLILAGAVLDVIGIASLVPVSQIVFNQEIIHSNAFVNGIYNALGFTSDKAFLLTILGALILLFVFKNVMSILIIRQQSRVSFSISTELARRQFNFILSHDLQYFNTHNSTLLVRHITSIPFALASNLLLPTLNFLSELIVIAIIVVSIAIYNFQVISMIAITLIPAFFLAYRFVTKRAHHYEYEKNRLGVLGGKYGYQTIFGYIDVKLFNKDHYFVSQFHETVAMVDRINVKIYTMTFVPGKIIELTAISGIVILFGFTILNPFESAAISGLLPLYIAAAYRIMPSINRMLTSLTNMKGNQYIFDILMEAKNTNLFLKQNLIKEKLSFKNEIVLKDVSFKYPGAAKQSLRDVSFTIKKGDKIGIIGKSGSGKTTFINVLLRFLKQSKGQILVDGVDLNANNETEWRNLIGYVKQNVFILDGDLYENIAFGDEKDTVDLEQIEKVVRLSKLDEVVDKLPKGLDTNIGENGTRLSGGQRQRVAIARALYKEAEILVFDEATSALDNQTEKEITDSIESLAQENTTMIIIAHRITTLKNCNRIYEMEDGHVIAEHTYSELAKTLLD